MTKSSVKFALLTRLRHGDLHNFKTSTGSNIAAAEQLEVTIAHFGDWYRLRRYPEFSKKLSRRLKRHLGKTWDELWPPELREQIDRMQSLNFTLKEVATYQDVPLCRLSEKQDLPALCYSDMSVETRELQTISRELIRQSKSRRILSSRESMVVEKLFGLAGSPPATLDEIATEWSVSRERIRQISVKAIDKLKRSPSLVAPLASFAGFQVEQKRLRKMDEERLAAESCSLREKFDGQPEPTYTGMGTR